MTAPFEYGALLTTIEEAIQVLKPLGTKYPWTSKLLDVHEQLAKRQQLVAVFGAFSTGKSSLINSIIQDSVLVVSPNPTTAAITHVHGKDASDALGQMAARVTAKSESQLWEDVKQSLRALHFSADTIDAALDTARSLKPVDFAPSARRFVGFLKAVAGGYEEMRAKLGTSFHVSAEELKKYTAEERFACFVHRVDLLTDSDVLHQSNVVLVDTPGVDSIHRRHTDVAFQYMQSADAILFVLYYTHAFSRADKEFIRQLADVQDIMGTNKVFVVINAVDLAESDEERTAVRSRVEAELRQLGMRSPRIYEVSSQLSVVARQYVKHPEDERFSGLLRNRLNVSADEPINAESIQENSGVPRLVSDLQAFLEEQGASLAEDSVRRHLAATAREIHRVSETLQLQAQEDAVSAANRAGVARDVAEQLADEERNLLDGQSSLEKGLQSEWDELVYHISERIRHRFSTVFRECFHPGRFRVTSQNKQQLQDAAIELAEVLSRAVEAEIRTFGLRVHRHVLEAIDQWTGDLTTRLEQRGLQTVSALIGSSHSPHAPQLPDRVNLSWETFRSTFRYFSSAKQFFESGGQQQMQNAAEPLALDVVTEATQSMSKQVRDEAVQAFRNTILAEIRQAEGELNDLADGPHTTPDHLENWTAAELWFARFE